MSKDSLITGVFTSSERAAQAIDALTQGGVSREDISIVAAEGTKVEAFGIQKQSKAGEGAAIGGGLGGAVGALVAGFTAVGALAATGVGIIAAGPLVAALAGAGAGAAAGGVLGGLIGLGIPEHEVKFYQDALNKGSVLVGVRSDSSNRNFIESTMDRYGAQRGTVASKAGGTSATGATATAGSAASAVSADEWAEGNPLRRLFIEQVQDVYYAEQQLVDAIPKLRDQASHPELVRAFETHLAQTRTHVQRLEQIFRELGVKAKSVKCPAINGIIAESKDLSAMDTTPALRDAALVCAAQKAEHYEIATYGCLRAYAEALGLAGAAQTLQQTLSEEVETDRLLSELAERHLNPMAAAPMGREPGASIEPKPATRVVI